ncbi:MAG: hypothetical protein Q8P67_23010, partial [archaeon]|nr:hypothetical protein [archaeon]
YLVSHSQFKYLSHVASLSLARIADFDYLFSRRLPFWSRFDECLWIALPPSCLPCYALDPLREPLHRLTSFVIEAVLHRGLGERARLLCVSGGAVQCPDWQPYGPAPRDQHQPTTVIFFVGLRLCPATSHKMVVMGPPADHPAPALAFRELWGERAEIRRFKDGGINLTAVWQTPSHLLHTVTKQIVEYLLRRHVQHEEAPSPLVITHLADQLDARLLTPAEDTSVQIGEFFERLCSHIRQLDRLPLPIHTIRASSAIFSRTDLAPPQPSPHAMSGTSQKRPRSCDQHLSEVVCVKPFEAVIQFVPNGHWPGEVQAIERLKTAFFVEISEQLAAVTGIQSTPWETHLDVFLAGFVFRFFIHHPALLPLLKANDGLVLQEMRNSHVFRPDHVSFVLTLSNRFPAYARTVALAKHWVHLHMFSDFLREEAVELLVASVFCNSSFSDPADERGELPNRHLLAFLRFLQLVAFHPWSQEPLLIDSDGISFSPDSLAAIRTRFDRKNARKRIGMYLATPYDRHCKFACDPEHPSQQILDRFVSYARQALQLIPSFFSLEPAFLESSSSLLPADAFDRLYQPSYTEFDLVIQLDKHACLGKALTAKQRHRLFGMQKYQNLVQGDGRSQLLVGFDAPAHFLSLLKQRYGKFAMFFVDGHRQSIIGLVWKPKAFMPKTFHPAGSQLMMPIDTLGLLLPNIIEIISEINLLGSGLIKKLIRK